MAAAEAVVRAVSETDGNVLTCWIGEEAVSPARNLFAQVGIPSYESPGIAVRAFLHRVRYRQNQELLIQTPRSVPETFVPTTDVARDAVHKTLAEGKQPWPIPRPRQSWWHTVYRRSPPTSLGPRHRPCN